MQKRNWNDTALLVLADLVLILLALYLATLGRLYLPYGVPLTKLYVALPWPVYIMGGLVWLSVSAALVIYSPQRTYSRLDETWAVIGAVLLSNLALAGLLYISYRDVPRLLFLYSLLLQIVFLVCVRLALYLVQRRRPGERVLIVGAGRVGLELAQRIQAASEAFTLVGYLDDDPAKQGQDFEGAPVLGATDRATELIDALNVDEVIFALPLRAHQHLVALILSLQALPVRVRVVPDLFDVAFFRATIDDFRGIPLIGLRDPAIDGTRRVVKRLFDLILGSIMLIIALPVLGLVAVAIVLDSPGPALFRQQRVGENGRVFTIYKFRSMRAGAADVPPRAADAACHKRPDDPRVTRVGRVIRHTSLDELPQLFNVIKGDMSLVGPRPELPWLVAHYEAWQRQRFAVPPGITGWWQINGRSDRPMHQHTEDDLYYIRHYSPWLDLRILWRTIGAVLRGKGAY